jgi:flagellar hook protein FlgE
MSINSALLSGVSGLLANATKLATISDNISNVNTTGYKRNYTDFQTVVTARGGSRASYSAGGVLSQSGQRIAEQGQLQRTTSATDLAIDGQGFFITTDRAENVTSADPRAFTRAGAFTLDKFGYLQNSAGGYLQGWPVDAKGQIELDPSDLTRLEAINIAQLGGGVEPTTKASVRANLDNGQPISVGAAAYDPDTNSMADYDPATAAGVKPDFELSIPVSDTKGGRRSLVLSFLKAADAAGDPIPNTWHAEIRAVPASDVERADGGTNGQIRAGTLVFTQTGQLDTANSTLFGDPYDDVLAISASDDATLAAGEVKWADSLGIGAQSLEIDLDSAAASLTQQDNPTVVRSVTTDGTAAGSLTSVEIDPDGFVTAIFDNGVTRKVAQVAIATFPNPDGLKALSGNSYLASRSSGGFNLKVPGTGGAGAISPSTLEASTVDLSSEFTGLITTQRAYSASSKIITTADEMLEELIRIKR